MLRVNAISIESSYNICTCIIMNGIAKQHTKIMDGSVFIHSVRKLTE